MQNRVQIVNRALTLLGISENVGSLYESENSSIFADDIAAATYSLLARHKFKFASKFAVIEKSKEQNDDDFYVSYDLPKKGVDFVHLIDIYDSTDTRSLLNDLDDVNIGGNRKVIMQGNKILLSRSYAGNLETLKIRYIERILFSDETSKDNSRDGYSYPFVFCEALALHLAIRNSNVIRNDPNLVSQLYNLYHREIEALLEGQGTQNTQPAHVNVFDPGVPEIDVNILTVPR